MRSLERSDRQHAPSGVRASHALFFAQLVTFLVFLIGNEAAWFEPAILALGVSDAGGLLAQPWSVFTYPFVSLHPLEFVAGFGILLLAGVAVEERLGRRRFVVLYALSAILAALVHIGLYEAGLVEGRLFLGPVGPAAGILTAYLFLLGADRQVGSIPFPVFYLITASCLFVALAMVDQSNQKELQRLRDRCLSEAHKAESLSPEERLAELERAGFLGRQSKDQLGHMIGLVVGGLGLLLSRVMGRAHERYRVLREIRGLQEEVDARARVELLLVKINDQGLESLSRHERRFLRYASRFYVQHPPRLPQQSA